MAYRVSIAVRARHDLVLLYERINAKESPVALRWYDGLSRTLISLEDLPNRGAVTPESKQYRHLLYGHKPHIYRVIYRVWEKKKQVEILHIRHGARRAFKSGDVRGGG